MRLSKKATAPEKLFLELLGIMEKLRSVHGCPWDKHQTYNSLLPFLFSEAGEFKRAVKKKDHENMLEELGDILLQVVFHSQIASEKGHFTISDVIDSINRKLIRRHPHVFAGMKAKTPKEVIKLWKEIKRQEKQERSKQNR